MPLTGKTKSNFIRKNPFGLLIISKYFLGVRPFSFEVHLSKVEFTFKMEDCTCAFNATLNSDRRWVLN